MDISRIHEKDIRIFMISRTKNLWFYKKATKMLSGYISRVVFNARKEKLIAENPVEFLQAKDFYRHCSESETDPQERLVSPNEMDLLFR